MNDREHQEETVFEQAAQIESNAKRAAYLDQACQGDPALRTRLEVLLEGYFKGQGFLEDASGQTAECDRTRRVSLAEEEVGKVIGRYKLLEKVGEGGFGAVYVAEHVTKIMEWLPWTVPQTYVSFSPNSLDPASWLEIEAAYTHPSFTYHARANPYVCDVGVIILKSPVEGVPLAPLPSPGFLDDLKQAKLLREPGQGGVPFRVAGYGGSLTFPPPVVVFPGDGWRKFADSDLLNVLPGWVHLLQNPATGNGGTQDGDSGGPVFWIQPDGTRVLVALNSWGDHNEIAMSFCWRLDIPESLDFINQILQGLEP